MLTRRTNILLSESDHSLLSWMAMRQGRTMGELIREAVNQVYRKQKRLQARSLVLRQIDELAKRVNTKGVSYKQLVDDGRRY